MVSRFPERWVWRKHAVLSLRMQTRVRGLYETARACNNWGYSNRFCRDRRERTVSSKSTPGYVTAARRE